MIPSGSLNLRSKFAFSWSSPRSKKKFAARRLDPLLGRGDVVDLKTEMMGADEIAGVTQSRAALALIIGEREIDDAVAQIDRAPKIECLLSDALQVEDALVEFGSLHRGRRP